MKRRERLVARKTPYRGVLLTVQRDVVRLPDGTTGVREIVRHPGAVAIVPLGKWLAFGLAIASLIPRQAAVLWWISRRDAAHGALH